MHRLERLPQYLMAKDAGASPTLHAAPHPPVTGGRKQVGNGGDVVPSAAAPSPRRQQAPLTRRQISAMRTLTRDEENNRFAIEAWEAAAFGVVTQADQFVNHHHHRTDAKAIQSSLRRVEDALSTSHATGERTLAMSEQLLQVATTTASTLQLFVDYHSSDVRDKLYRLEVENATLRQSLASKEVENTRLFAEVDTLRDALSRAVIRTDVENDRLERFVRSRAEETRLDIDTMKKQLLSHIDYVVPLVYKKEEMATATNDLKSIVASQQQEVDRSMHELRALIEGIDAMPRFLEPESNTGVMNGSPVGVVRLSGQPDIRGGAKAPVGAAGGTANLSSNFPYFYREQLAELSQQQLIGLLDIVSFEPRVVACVGKALFEINSHRM